MTFNYIKKNNTELKKENIIKEINNHYNEFVKTNKESKLGVTFNLTYLV